MEPKKPQGSFFQAYLSLSDFQQYISIGFCFIHSGYIPYFCTGFLAFRNTTKSKELLSHWNASTYNNEVCNQVTFQEAVYQTNANGRILPLKLFPTGKIFFEQMHKALRDEVCVVHNNFIVGKEKKIQRFKHYELWYFNPKESKFKPY